MFILEIGYPEIEFNLDTDDDQDILKLLFKLGDDYVETRTLIPIDHPPQEIVRVFDHKDIPKFIELFNTTCSKLGTNDKVFVRYTPPELEADEMSNNEIDYYTKTIEIYKSIWIKYPMISITRSD